MSTPNHLSDRYELGEIIGFGGMSEVHLARDLRLHRDVAVKVLRADLARDPSFYLRFRREAQNAAALNHPAIVAVYDTGEAETASGPLPYIVMEYVDGMTLRDIVHTDGPIPSQRAIEIIADVCQALNFSHQHGIIHRDVKPANIMISQAGAVKVMDFGIARAIADNTSVTQTAAVIGTAQYLSPEQARGEKVDARSDVYSLGCVLYEILSGQPPFTGDSPVAVAYQHVREDPVPLSHKNPDIAPELDAVVLKALAKNPDNRYQTAAQMRVDLVRVHNGEAPEAPKVLSSDERTSMMTATSTHMPYAGGADQHQRGGGLTKQSTTPSRRWLATIAVFAVLTVVVAIGVTVIGGGRDVSVPDVRGKTSADAIVALQNQGFQVRTRQEPDSEVPPNYVISTDPDANSAVGSGDEITITVSTGPEQREVPDVTGLSYAEAVTKLKDAGFGKFRQVPGVSAPEQRNKVVQTIPPADQTSAITNVISIVVGSGPDSDIIPDVSEQTATVAQQILNEARFTNVVTVDIDSPLPAGQVVGTNPPVGQSIAQDTLIQIQISRGNQFVMPDLIGQFWSDAQPRLQALGWTGTLDKGADVRDSGQRTNAVVSQYPPAGAGVNFDGRITLRFAA